MYTVQICVRFNNKNFGRAGRFLKIVNRYLLYRTKQSFFLFVRKQFFLNAKFGNYGRCLKTVNSLIIDFNEAFLFDFDFKYFLIGFLNVELLIFACKIPITNFFLNHKACKVKHTCSIEGFI